MCGCKKATLGIPDPNNVISSRPGRGPSHHFPPKSARHFLFVFKICCLWHLSLFFFLLNPAGCIEGLVVLTSPGGQTPGSRISTKSGWNQSSWRWHFRAPGSHTCSWHQEENRSLTKHLFFCRTSVSCYQENHFFFFLKEVPFSVRDAVNIFLALTTRWGGDGARAILDTYSARRENKSLANITSEGSLVDFFGLIRILDSWNFCSREPFTCFWVGSSSFPVCWTHFTSVLSYIADGWPHPCQQVDQKFEKQRNFGLNLCQGGLIRWSKRQRFIFYQEFTQIANFQLITPNMEIALSSTKTLLHWWISLHKATHHLPAMKQLKSWCCAVTQFREFLWIATIIESTCLNSWITIAKSDAT